MKKLIGAMLIAFTTVANSAAYISNGDLIRWHAEDKNKSFIIMYAMAVNDIYDGNVTCVPFKTEGQVLYDTVFAYIKLAAIDDTAIAAYTIVKALKRAYPCVKKVPML